MPYEFFTLFSKFDLVIILSAGQTDLFFFDFSIFEWEFRILNALFGRCYMVPGYISMNHTETIKINDIETVDIL